MGGLESNGVLERRMEGEGREARRESWNFGTIETEMKGAKEEKGVEVRRKHGEESGGKEGMW